MPRPFNVSIADSLASLDRIERLEARALLPGHGDPSTEGATAVVARAREAGPS
jgi:glyoxylase-like metal-dependent hydrolase (beta-lactamase superfamily II)